MYSTSQELTTWLVLFCGVVQVDFTNVNIALNKIDI